DPTVGSYTINHLRKKILPKEKALTLINCEDIELHPQERKVFLKKKGMALDLGGIGKGYALEVIARKLEVSRGFLALSGDIKVWGERRVVGVYNPMNGEVLAYLVNAKDFCISTSGNYRRKHILGSSDFLQVTVVHESCTYADAYATAIFSGGEKLLKKLIDDGELGILVLYPDGRILLNHTFTRFFSEIHFQ
ncbi:FAD:protein FMN transferase, partial [Aquifex sp.]